MINVWIDDLTPCLKDNETGDFVATEVIRIRRKTFARTRNLCLGSKWYCRYSGIDCIKQE